MGDLSANFSLSEFACACCGQADPHPELIDVLELVREHFAAAITITSGYRCPDYNYQVGGAGNSQHLKNTASDIVISGVEPEAVQDYFDNLYDGYGLGRYDDFTHIDVREGRARWGS